MVGYLGVSVSCSCRVEKTEVGFSRTSLETASNVEVRRGWLWGWGWGWGWGALLCNGSDPWTICEFPQAFLTHQSLTSFTVSQPQTYNFPFFYPFSHFSDIFYIYLSDFLSSYPASIPFTENNACTVYIDISFKITIRESYLISSKENTRHRFFSWKAPSLTQKKIVNFSDLFCYLRGKY